MAAKATVDITETKKNERALSFMRNAKSDKTTILVFQKIFGFRFKRSMTETLNWSNKNFVPKITKKITGNITIKTNCPLATKSNSVTDN